MGATRAIIIGISKYSLAKDYLPGARPSAERLAKTLAQHYVFDDIELIRDEEATLAGITRALSNLRKLSKNDVALIVFCGHAKKMGERWYFVPQDACMDNTDHRLLFPDYELFLEYIDKMQASHICLIIDACYGGLVLKRTSITNDAVDPNTAVVEELMSPERPSRFVITAGDSAEAVLDGGGNGTSVFMEEVCDYLTTFGGPVLPATMLSSEIITRVQRRLQFNIAKQHPMADYIDKISSGIFCFIRKRLENESLSLSGNTQMPEPRVEAVVSTVQVVSTKQETDIGPWLSKLPLTYDIMRDIQNIEEWLKINDTHPREDVKSCRRMMTELRRGQFDEYFDDLKRRNATVGMIIEESSKADGHKLVPMVVHRALKLINYPHGTPGIGDKNDVRC